LDEEAPMFVEYFRIGGMSNPLLIGDLVSRVLFIVFCALILLILGSKVRRPLGIGVVIIYGIAVYMYNQGLLRF
jgi:Ca2+/Na+ antiporter